jgi:hypothetical protein
VAEHDGVGPFARDEIFDFVGGRRRVNNVMDQKFSRGELDDFRFV